MGHVFQELDAIIECAKKATIELRSEEDSEDEGEMSMYCITCGHEIHSRMAIKHMEKCFNKVCTTCFIKYHKTGGGEKKKRMSFPYKL